MKTFLTALLILLTIPAGKLAAQQSAPPNPCAAAEQKQLDFWVGEWELTWPGAKAGELAHGTNSIKRILDGCVVQENFAAADGSLRGSSVSIFDGKSWKQTWVDNLGSYLDFVGGMADGHMYFKMESTGPDGKKVWQRMVWNNVTATEFDWSWEKSSDSGKTWTVQWPIHYKRKA